MEKGLALDPNHPYGRGEVLHMRMYTADWHDYAARKAELEQLVREGARAVQPFIFEAIAETPADAQACSRIWRPTNIRRRRRVRTIRHRARAKKGSASAMSRANFASRPTAYPDGRALRTP